MTELITAARQALAATGIVPADVPNEEVLDWLDEQYPDDKERR